MLDIIKTDITLVECRRTGEGQVSGLNVNITLEDVLARGEQLEITFVYVATYAENIGTLTMRGRMIVSGELQECQEASKKWRETHQLPHDVAEDVLNTINYLCSTNGTFVSRTVNLPAPMLPPHIEVKDEGAGASA